jgi:hypothetical protein
LAKISGLGATVIIDDGSGSPQTITNDVTEFSMSTPVALQDITGVDKSAHERLPLLADASFSLKGVFNTASNMSHAVFKTVPAGGAARTSKIAPTASSGASPYLSCNLLYTGYDITRSAAGDLTWSAPGQLADGTVPSWS